jgi:hypothetical protein
MVERRRGTKLPERSGTLAEDPFSGRDPTSHERLAGLPWDASYHDGPAPWDTGQPHVASLGLPVLGVDVAETALRAVPHLRRRRFSDDGPGTGPHPVSQEELRAAFSPGSGWNVAAIEPDRVQTRYHDDGAPAWFAAIKRI